MLDIYKSSAGSGKTFLLVKEYLKIAFVYPNNFKKILAITFTNKSANELKNKILNQLKKMSRFNNDDPISKNLMEEYNLDRTALKKRSKEILENIIYEYEEFSIMTIDSFFQLLLSSCINEVSISENFNYELDINYIVIHIIQNIYSLINDSPFVLNSLKNFAFYRLKNAQKWQFENDLNILTLENFNENFLLKKFEISNFFKGKDLINNLYNRFKNFIDKYEKKHISLAKKIIGYIEKHNLKIEDFLYKEKGIIGYFYNLSIGKIKLLSERSLEVLADPNKWCPKSSCKKDLIINLSKSYLNDIVKQLQEYQNENSKTYFDFLMILKYLYLLNINESICSSYEKYKNENNSLTTIDVLDFLTKFINKNNVSFIYEKIDQQYRHFLIDEFQDVSNYQWQILSNLIKNSISQGFKSIIVGDSKQSIYRWRGANSNLLSYELESDFSKQDININYLNKNWRSSNSIVNFNNIFFDNAIKLVFENLKNEILNLELDQGLEKKIVIALNNLCKSYNKLEQIPLKQEKTFENKYNNSITIRKNIDFDLYVKERIKAIQNNGITEIAILCRNNEQVCKINSCLKNSNEKNILKTFESSSFKNSTAVDIIINSLNFLETKDTYYLIVLNYLFNKDKIECINNDFFDIDEKKRNNIAIKLFEISKNITNIHILEIVNIIVKTFELRKFYHDEVNLFLEYILELEENYTVQDFLFSWNNKTLKIDTKKDNDVKVMTIHQSKGLEFDAVIIPFCDWLLDHSNNNSPILWCKTDKKNNLPPFVPIKYSKNMLYSNYIYDYLIEKINIYLDNLNLLYVAFTRAKEELHINIKNKNSYLKDISDLVNKIHMKDYMV